jgi:DNA polymerase (family 10)
MATKADVIAHLEELALLLELDGANVFRIRAYQNAVRTLEGLTEDFATLVEGGQLEQVKGIGKGLSQLIQGFFKGEPDPEYDALKARIPAGLFDILQLPGIGPKKVKAMYEDLGIASLGELEYACHENRLVTMKGFGAKTQTNILKGIEQLKSRQGKFLYPFAREKAEAVLAALRSDPRLIRLELAGSLRRHKEIVKDIDIVGSCAEADCEGLMASIAALPMVTEVIGQGLTKTSVRLASGLSLDVRLVSDAEFPHALLHFTGSKEHNTALRGRAKELGLKINEYGLFQGEEAILCADEEAIFARLGLVYIPPERRENMGEIEAAASGSATVLVQNRDIQGALHAHTTWSDGADTLEAMVRACQARGYHYLGVSEHSQSAVYAHGLEVERVRAQQLEIAALREKYPDFYLFSGIEVDILPDGSLDYDDELLASFDFVIASVHSRFKMSEEEMTARLVKAIHHPAVTMLGHLTGRLLLAREGYPLNMARILDACAETGTAIELNAHPSRLDLDWRYCGPARDRGIKIAVNPDAHSVDGLDVMRYGVGIARKGGLTPADVLNTWSAPELAQWLAQPKTARRLAN